MITNDWENPATDYVAFRSDDPRAPYRLEIDRIARSAIATDAIIK
jgi:hypothetical protein